MRPVRAATGRGRGVEAASPVARRMPVCRGREFSRRHKNTATTPNCLHCGRRFFAQQAGEISCARTVSNWCDIDRSDILVYVCVLFPLRLCWRFDAERPMHQHLDMGTSVQFTRNGRKMCVKHAPKRIGTRKLGKSRVFSEKR